MQSLIALFVNWFFQLLLGATPLYAQVEESYAISDKLNEISGLEMLNDSTLIAFNDGGNKSEIYLLNLKGEILRNIDVLDTKNRDWEDIARDDDYVYIGDIGNNTNEREKLSIVRIKIADILTRDEVEAEQIKFNYAEQTSFPPKNDSLYFDAEAMAVINDSIWIFTKDRSKPYQGVCHIYKVPTKPGKYTVTASDRLQIGGAGWWTDGVTAADYANGKLILLTYNRFITYDFSENTFEKISEFKFGGITQRESLVVLNKDAIFVADEHNPIVGEVRLYKIKYNSD
ncbi:MAG: hypothetical protein Crog4KO_19640 [Crocinitomicaceae bacterium]